MNCILPQLQQACCCSSTEQSTANGRRIKRPPVHCRYNRHADADMSRSMFPTKTTHSDTVGNMTGGGTCRPAVNSNLGLRTGSRGTCTWGAPDKQTNEVRLPHSSFLVVNPQTSNRWWSTSCVAIHCLALHARQLRVMRTMMQCSAREMTASVWQRYCTGNCRSQALQLTSHTRRNAEKQRQSATEIENCISIYRVQYLLMYCVTNFTTR